MKQIYYLTTFLQLVYLKLSFGLHFIRTPAENNTPRYIKITNKTLLKWTIELTTDDLNSKTQEVWVRLEKLMKDESVGESIPDPTAYTPITPFRKVTDLMKTGDEFVRKIRSDLFEIGFYVTAKHLDDSGYYRIYVKTDDELDYFSYPYKLKVVEPPNFIGCLQSIKAETSEVGNTRFDKTLPQLKIQSSCVASGHPQPKVYCILKKSRVLAQMLDNRAISFQLDEWDGTKPTIQCIADGGAAGVVVVQEKDYFVFHKPIAPQEIKQLPSHSETSIRLQWNRLSKDDAGGEIHYYVLHYRALWYGQQQTIYLSAPKPYHHISNKAYYVQGNIVYYELNSLVKAQNYSISLQVYNIQGRIGYITDTVMRSGFQVPKIDAEVPVTSTHLTKSTTMIIATFALAGVLILLLLIAILYRRRMLIRRARCQCNSHERIREQRDFFSMAGSFTSPFVLPSYEEAVRTKPTEAPPSFEDLTDEPFQELRITGQNSSRDDVSLAEEPTGVAPPPYPGSSTSTTYVDYITLHNSSLASPLISD